MHKQTCQDLRLTHASLKGFKDKLSYHIPEQLQAWVMETMDISVSDASNHIMMALDSKRCGPKGKGIWFLDPISIFSKLATKFTGFLVCQPHYNDSIMLNMVRHAIYSSLFTESATAIFSAPP